MPKIKKNYVANKNPTSDDENTSSPSEDGGNSENYDSMIENGSSEEIDDKKDEQAENEVVGDNSENYDSMIENGSSDDSDDSDNEQADSKKDRFSENKTKILQQKRKLPQTTLEKEKQEHNEKKFKSEKHLYKQATVEEINQLRETENLFHSNLFRMQIEEMLNEIRVKEKYITFAQTWLNEFNEFVDNIESMPEKVQSDQLVWLQKSKIKLPLDLKKLLQTKSFYFQYLKPAEKPFLIGSGRTGALIGPTFHIDICILMPEKFFQKEDYLNMIYDQKRALYLSYITLQMSKSSYKSCDLKFNYFQNNPCKPVLEITPNSKIGKRLCFRVFVAPNQGSFKLSRFVPWNSNIRSTIFKQDRRQDDDNDLQLATPNYNGFVLHDLTMKPNQLIIDEVLIPNKNLKEGLMLLKIWLRQRKLDIGFSGFSSHIMTMFIVFMFKQKKLHASMSSYQVARNVWNHLALSNWNVDRKGITICSNIKSENQPTLEQFHTYYDVVFIDSTGFYNICSNLCLDIYLRIKYECQRAVQMLDNKQINSFQLLFMNIVPIYTQYDHILKICNNSVVEKTLNAHGTKDDMCNYARYWYPMILKLVTNIIRKGLGNRIVSMNPLEDTMQPWSITAIPQKLEKSLKIGFVLDPDYAYNNIDKGPQANDDNVEEFRSFWGDKSQLRRFKDGSITEACIWCPSKSTLCEKRVVVQEIIYHLLKHHFGLEKSDIGYSASELDITFRLNKLLFVFEDGLNDAETTSLNLIQVFDELGKNLRSIDSLPLDITSVQGISPVFRYCEPRPILAQGKSYRENEKLLFQAYSVNDGIIQLGISGKWPNEIEAFRHIKTAFHIQISNSLREQFKLETRGDQNGVHVLKDGYVFRLEIAHPKEITLLKREVSVKGVTEYNDTPESIQIEKRFNILPKITSALHGLYQRFPSFGPTVLIAKRWLYSQLIDSYLWPDECTELLIAYQFLNMGAMPNPCQPQTGFFRFLHLLSTCDWTTQLFIINFNDEISRDDIIKLDNEFCNDRNKFPTLGIVTSFDLQRYGVWAKNDPCPQILARVTILARHTLEILQDSLLKEEKLNVNDLFVPSLDGYDAIINLRSNLVQTFQGVDFKPISKSNVKIDASVPAAGFDPVKIYLEKLRETFSDFAVFFYNPCGGMEIAVIWKPDVFLEKEFKVANVIGCQVNSNGKLQCSIKQFIEDFKVIGRGLYLTIEDLRMKRTEKK